VFLPLVIFLERTFGPEAALLVGGLLLVIGSLGKSFEKPRFGRERWSRKRLTYLLISGALSVLASLFPKERLDFAVLALNMLIAAIRS
jgi:hypothetical protein